MNHDEINSVIVWHHMCVNRLKDVSNSRLILQWFPMTTVTLRADCSPPLLKS